MRAATVPLLLLSVAACNEEPERTEYKAPNYCSRQQAKHAGESRVADILARVENEDTRFQACSEIDDILRSQSFGGEFDKYRPANCEWGPHVDDDPYGFAEAVLRKNGDHLSELCEWRRRDAERRGQRILDSLPPEERRQIERDWNGYVQ